jgi:DNA processing protein
MDLPTAVALSTLPVSRCRAAALFKELRRQSRHTVTLEEVIAASSRDVDVERTAAAARESAATLLTAAARGDIVAVPWNDERYPALLAAIVDPPPVLWVRGSVDALSAPAVAIIGSRAATPYAREVASRLAGELAERGVVVVSGLARGADGAAHRGCLDANGTTVAVLGSGPDTIYPAEHRELAVSICQSGALMSELGPGAPPLPEHFPLRNRLISGISLAVVVVEASERSGSLITARCALEQGRDVLAVPGSILSGRNRGSHGLLKDGAKVVETADDILEELGWPGAAAASLEPSKLLKSDPLLERMAVDEGYGLEDLADLIGLVGPRLLARLTEWELQGRLIRLPGGRFRRPAQPV